ncbi:MAG TPA: hypothetical protein PLE43_02980 [Alphaproteobacteria bacterium]|jgi:Ca2+-binding EF-hand superfamily protein|nr:hypothetical protein [Alphaproteobacteria bacterium]HRK97423.1 hypothetical protein [Alphaproteobacteria bacterium]
MNKTNKILIAGAALFILGGVGSSYAKDFSAEIEQRLDVIKQTEKDMKTATVRVEVAPKDASGRESIDFSEFDINHDGVFEREEVGEKLFTIFDKDKNGVIDNLEMKKIGLRVYSPMQKKTIETVDYTTPGKEQRISVTEEEFIQQSKLIKFDKEEDGLSPIDFLGMPFNQVNVKNDGVIDLYEWKRAYAASVKPLHIESFQYND